MRLVDFGRDPEWGIFLDFNEIKAIGRAECTDQLFELLPDEPPIGVLDAPFDSALSERYLVYALSTITARWLARSRPDVSPIPSTCAAHPKVLAKVTVDVAAKGGGSENKSKFKMMNPSDSIVDWVLEMLPQMGAGWCPPGMLGIGIGGTAEKAMLLAKESLMEPIDITELQARGASNRAEELRLELYEKVNALGIGAQGLGGLTTVLDIKVKDYPTHAANLPVAMIPNCAATRHAHFTLDGSGPAYLEPPKLDEWPKVDWQPDAAAKRDAWADLLEIAARLNPQDAAQP